ncbi:hypothetical protein CSB11_02705 [Candidatus Campbellbacteria bacterium]|nr:MAG: hypothetical protein CSB11_02705 [Candidatus Campbellbacteria bacterium]
MKKKKLIILFVVFVVAASAFAYFYKQNQDFAKNISIEKTLEEQIKNIEMPTKGEIEMEIGVKGEVEGEKIDFKMKSAGKTQQDLRNKKLDFDLKNKISANIDTEEFGKKEIKDLEVDFGMKLVDDSMYFKVSTDLDKLMKIFEDDKQIQSGIQFFGMMINNKDFFIDLKKLESLDPQGVNNIDQIYSLDEQKQMLAAVKNSYLKHKPFKLNFLNQTDSVNGSKAGKFEVEFDTEKLIDFYVEVVKENIKKNPELNSEDVMKEIDRMSLVLKENKDILENNIKGNMYLWITQDNKIVKSKVNLEFDFIKLGNELDKKMGGNKTVQGNLDIKLNITATENKANTIEIEKPEKAVDVMTMMGGFMMGGMQPQEPVAQPVPTRLIPEKVEKTAPSVSPA